jgi:hypothetical protein
MINLEILSEMHGKLVDQKTGNSTEFNRVLDELVNESKYQKSILEEMEENINELNVVRCDGDVFLVPNSPKQSFEAQDVICVLRKDSSGKWMVKDYEN